MKALWAAGNGLADRMRPAGRHLDSPDLGKIKHLIGTSVIKISKHVDRRLCSEKL